MQDILEIIRSIDKAFNEDKISSPLNECGIDSLGLIELRVAIEKYNGQEIPQLVWNGFESISDIFEYCRQTKRKNKKQNRHEEVHELSKNYAIEMPLMANYALSENWLFKELGNNHWELLCTGLGKESNSIVDDQNNRLYATFVRIILSSNSSLREFRENDRLDVAGEINRYGKNNYFSNFTCKSNDNTIDAALITTFCKRESDNNIDLTKCIPNIPNITIPEYDDIPKIFTEYRLMKKNLKDNHYFDGTTVDLEKKNIHKEKYQINPYYDLNGVGLLYFAAYPTISDYCESQYFNSLYPTSRWEDEYFTLARDIFYYANCNISDTIIYSLNSYEFLNNSNKIVLYSSLQRESDNITMADIFTIKEKYGK